MLFKPLLLLTLCAAAAPTPITHGRESVLVPRSSPGGVHPHSPVPSGASTPTPHNMIYFDAGQTVNPIQKFKEPGPQGLPIEKYDIEWRRSTTNITLFMRAVHLKFGNSPQLTDVHLGWFLLLVEEEARNMREATLWNPIQVTGQDQLKRFWIIAMVGGLDGKLDVIKRAEQKWPAYKKQKTEENEN